MIRILLIEDNPGDARLLSELLKEADGLIKSHELHRVERVGEGVTYLTDHTDVDIIVSDVSLPDSSGIETFEVLHTAAAGVPILFMTGSNDDEMAIAAIHKGAQDYMIKGHITSDGLARAILYAVERTKFQADMTKASDEIQSNKQQVVLLAAQKKQLEALNKAKDEFISLASHQLRTPATAVKQCIGMILEDYAGPVVDEQRSLLQTAYNSNDRQLQIINDLLKTAQLDSNMYSLKLTKCNITNLVAETINENTSVFELRKQTLLYDPKQPATASVDANELKLVLVNLLENASKYTPQNKQVCVDVYTRDAWLYITVTDEGVGINVADQKRIFEKFTRVDNALSDTVNGTGLGLYWVRQIINLHKGTITVQSTVGEGSTFTIRIPA